MKKHTNAHQHSGAAQATTHAAGFPAPEAIALRAYELFVQRGREDGHAEEDWLRAESEVTAATHSGLAA